MEYQFYEQQLLQSLLTIDYIVGGLSLLNHANLLAMKFIIFVVF